MAGAAFSVRERTLALLAAVVIGVSLLASLVVKPLWSRLESVQQRGDVSQKRLERLRRLVARGPSIERAYLRYSAFRSPEPVDRVQAKVLSELEEFARDTGVQMSLKPRPAATSDQVHTLPMELQVDGSQKAVLGFIDRVFSWARVVELERLRLSTSASSQQPLRAHLVVKVHVFRAAPGVRFGPTPG